MDIYDIIIIGAGASGLMCASNLKNKKVLILEKENKIGKKILVTGNGRCNLTNSNLNHNFYNTKLVDTYFNQFDNDCTLKYFKNLGLECYKDNEGRYYPISNHAKSVLDVLKISINKNKQICIKTNEKVVKICNNHEKFLVRTSKQDYVSTNIVISMGGNFNNIFDFVVPYNEFDLGLCSLITEKNEGLNGVRQKNVKVTLKQNCKIITSEIGEIIFKENAISGICIFNLSNYVNKGNYEINIDLLPQFDDYALFNNLLNRTKIFDVAQNILTGFFYDSLCVNILKKCNIHLNEKCSQISIDQLKFLSKTIKNYSLKVCGKDTNNQIFTGGVSLNDLDSNLMLNNNLNVFFCGESCDVNGVCGGYNLQWAWTSGYIISNYLNNKKL